MPTTSPKAEADPDFTGFHALEYGLFAGGDVDMAALADRLDTDIQSLIGEVEVLEIQPQVMTNGAAALIEEAAQTKITGEEERYSGTDLVTLQANVDGANKVFVLVSPLLAIRRQAARRRSRRRSSRRCRPSSTPTARPTGSSRTAR